MTVDKKLTLTKYVHGSFQRKVPTVRSVPTYQRMNSGRMNSLEYLNFQIIPPPSPHVPVRVFHLSPCRSFHFATRLHLVPPHMSHCRWSSTDELSSLVSQSPLGIVQPWIPTHVTFDLRRRCRTPPSSNYRPTETPGRRIGQVMLNVKLRYGKNNIYDTYFCT